MRSLILVAACALIAVSSFAATPLPGIEFPLAPQPIVPRAFGDSLNIASSPFGFLLVSRSGDRFFGRRLSADGVVVDANPFAITPPASGGEASVTWNGSDYVLTLRSDRFNRQRDEAWIISPDGGTRSLTVPPPYNARGEGLVTEVDDEAGSAKTYAVAINGTRRALNRAIAIKAAVALGDDWGILEQGLSEVSWYRIQSDGNVSGFRIANVTEIVSSAIRGDEIAIVWRNWFTVGYSLIDARTGAETHRETLSETNGYYATAIAFDGPDVVIARVNWEDGKIILRLKKGDVTRTIATYDSSYVTDVAVVPGLLIWNVTGGGNGAQSFIRKFDNVDDERPNAPFLGSAPQFDPRAVAVAGGLFTAWREATPQPRLMSRLYPGGDATLVSDLMDVDSQSVAATSDTYAVVWAETIAYNDYRIFIRRYDLAGNALDASPVLVARQSRPRPPNGMGWFVPRVAAIGDGSSFVVAWIALDPGNYSGIVYGARVPSRGAVSVTPVRLSDEDWRNAGLALVRLGGRITAVHQFQPKGTIAKRIEALRLNDDLGVEWRSTLWDVTHFNGTLYPEIYDRNSFDAASSGDELLVTWAERERHYGDFCVYTRRFTAGLNPVEPARAITCGGRSTYIPSASHDGTSWWVTAKADAKNVPLNAWRLAPDGAPEPPIAIADGYDDPSAASLAAVSSGVTFLYTHNDRAFLRPLTTGTRRRTARH